MGAAGIPVPGVVHPVVFGRKLGGIFFSSKCINSARDSMTRKILSVKAMDERHKGSICFLCITINLRDCFENGK